MLDILHRRWERLHTATHLLVCFNYGHKFTKRLNCVAFYKQAAASSPPNEPIKLDELDATQSYDVFLELRQIFIDLAELCEKGELGAVSINLLKLAASVSISHLE